ncbi:PTS sugar transporter subunit IIA [Faecalicoccus pleomorphus]
MAIDEKKEQMSMLQVLMKIFQDKELLEEIKSIKTSEEICQKLNAFLQKI